MGNMLITELDLSDSEQIQSDPPSSPKVGYQAAVFNLLPNRSNPNGRCQISVVSLDSESFNGEDDQQQAERLHRNALRADHRANEDVICQGEQDLENAECRNPRVGRRRGSPPRPRNLENEFVLDYDDHEVFATPSANMAVVLQVFEGLPQTLEIAKGQCSSPHCSNLGSRPEEGVLQVPGTIELQPLGTPSSLRRRGRPAGSSRPPRPPPSLTPHHQSSSRAGRRQAGTTSPLR